MMIKKPHPIPKTYHILSPAYVLATWFHSGRFRPGSGTWGTVAGLPFLFVIDLYAHPLTFLIFAVLLFPIGLWASRDYGQKTGEKDASPVVIDEVCGLAIAMAPFGFHPILWVWSFVLFRVFDMFKFGPVGWCDKHLPGEWGVMMDDVVAGILAASSIILIHYFIGA